MTARTGAEATNESDFVVQPGGWTPRLVGILILLILPSEVAFLAFAYPLNALTQIGAEFSTTQVAWMQTAFALTAAVTAAITGNLADRFGKRRVLIVLMALVVIGLLVSTFAPTYGLLLLGRVLQGPALSISFLTPSLVRDIFPTRTVPLAVSLVTSGAAVLSIFATLGVGFVITGLGFRATFWLPAIVAAILIVLVRLFVPESPSRTAESKLDALGAILLGAGVAGVLLGVSLGSTWGWTSFATLGCIGVGAVILVLWVLQNLRTPHPIIDLRSFAHFPLAVTLLITAIGISGATWFYITISMVALSPGGVLGWGLGLTPEAAGLIASLNSLGAFVAGFVVGRSLSRFRAPNVAAAVFVTMIVGFTLAALGLQNAIVFGVATLLVGAVSGATYAVAFNLLILVVERQRQASMASIVTLVGNLAAAILPVVIFAIMNSMMVAPADGTVPYYPPSALWIAYLLPAALGVIALVFAVLLASRTRGSDELQAGTRS